MYEASLQNTNYVNRCEIVMPIKKPNQLAFKEFTLKTKTVRARLLLDSETVACYNGVRIGQKGDYVVIDDEDRVMIMKHDKFITHYEEDQCSK